MRILYLGPWASDQALFGRKAPNQAATRWARGLVHGLARSGCKVRICTHCRERYWPRGELWPGAQVDFERAYPVRFVKYANVPLLRNAWLSAEYLKMVLREIEECKPDVVLAYNLEPYHCAVSGILKQRGIKWIPIILDQADPTGDDWTSFKKQVRDVSGVVFLSHWGYQNCPINVPLLHLDGGIAQWRGRSERMSDGRSVVYSGKFDDHHGGLDRLFNTFAAVKREECEFLLTGKDVLNRLTPYLKKEKRARYLGFLEEDKLQEIHGRATVFVNPIPADVSVNRMNFPSKLLDYLSYGKPVVSTWTDGLSPEYRDLLMVPAIDNSIEYARLIDQTFLMDLDTRAKMCRKIEKWVETTHTWDIQANRLMSWLTDQI